MNLFQVISKKISPFLQSKGFCQSKRTFYYVKSDIAYCIGFEAPNSLMYVTAYVMPLYIPCETRYLTYGNRLNSIDSVSLPLLHKEDGPLMTDEWCDLLCQCIDRTIIPFFDRIDTPVKLVEYLSLSFCSTRWFFACPEVFIERLKMFTYLYLQDASKTISSMDRYRTLLQKCDFMTNSCRQRLLNQVDEVSLIIQKGADDRTAYCMAVINNTRRLL